MTSQIRDELKKELREQGLSREEVEQRLRERKLTHEEMEPLRRSFDYAAHWLTEDYVPAATDAERNCGASRAGWAYPVLIGAAVDIRR